MYYLGGFMKGFVCGVCAYVAIDGKAPENCPVCGAPKSSFTEGEVKTAADPKNLTELEKKHIPSIKLSKTCGLIPEGCSDVHVRIGETLHPSAPEHFIVHIDFYIDKVFVARSIIKPEKVNPAAALHLKINKGLLSVVEFCNQHGNWIKEVSL